MLRPPTRALCASAASSARTDSSRSSTGVSSSLVWLRPRRLLTKSITVGMTRAISAASCSGPLGRRCEVPATSSITASAMSMSSPSNGIGSICQMRSQLTSQPSSAAIRSLASFALASMSASTSASRARWSSDSSQHAVEGRDDAGADLHDPGRRPHVVAAGGVLAQGQRAAGGGQEGVAAHLHRRRAGVGVQAGEAHGVALDAEGAQHGAQRLVDRLEHRALLDVQLEVGGRALERRARVERRVEVDAVLAQRVGQRRPVAVGEAAHRVGLQRAGGRARAQQAAPEARALLVGPADELERQRPRLGRLRAQHLEAGEDVEDPVEPPAVGTESRCPPMITKRSESPGAVAQRLPATSLSTLTPSMAASWSRNQSLAAFQVSVQATRWAPSSSPVRPFIALAGPQRLGPGRSLPCREPTPHASDGPGSACSEPLPRQLHGAGPRFPACPRHLPRPRRPTWSAVASAPVRAASQSLRRHLVAHDARHLHDHLRNITASGLARRATAHPRLDAVHTPASPFPRPPRA